MYTMWLYAQLCTSDLLVLVQNSWAKSRCCSQFYPDVSSMKSAYNFLESRERSKNAVGERLGVRTEDHFPMQTRGNEELVPVLQQGRPSSYGADPPEFDEPFPPQSPRKGFFQMAFEGIKTNLLPGAILQVRHLRYKTLPNHLYRW